MGLSRRGWLIAGALWLALLLGTGAWTAVTIWPIWSAAHAGWFAEGTVGACAAVSALRSVQAVWAGSDGVSSGPGDLPAAGVMQPVRISGLFDGVWRSARVVIAVVPGETLPLDPLVVPPRAVRVVLVDAASGAPLLSVFGLDDPASRCEFNVRRALRASLSPSLLSVAGVMAIGALLGGIGLVGRLRRARWGVTG